MALLADEPAAGEVEEILREDAESWVLALNLAEAIDVSQRVHGIDAAEIRASLQPLVLSRAFHVVRSGEEEAWSAAALRAKHYDRRTRALSLADCFLLTHALDAGASIATTDPPLAASARAEGATVIALPDSAGQRP